ncbi:MAG: SDR family oxidoreductase [Planctomycetes bacterium]|nr:SDR family oxidoreductase [Planctomycetota bacterium]
MERTVIVTGASRGIGRAVALELALAGYDLLLIARSAPQLAQAASACAKKGVLATALVLDVTARDAGAQLAKAAGAMPRRVWGLVNNAGMAQSAPLAQTDDELLLKHMELNFHAPMRLTRAAVPLMQSGCVVNVCSTAALTGYPYVSAYAASKHALLGATRSLAREFAQKGITFNAVCPGYVRTEMFGQTLSNIAAKAKLDSAGAEQKLAALSPQNRIFEPGEVAKLVRFVLSDDARGINGQALTIDGGEIEH